MKGFTALALIVILDAVALLIFGLGTYGIPAFNNQTVAPPAPPVGNPNWTFQFNNRILLNVTSTIRLNELVEVNLTSQNVTCGNVNCSDVYITDMDNNSVQYQVPLFNISTYDKGINNTWVIIKMTNATQKLYYVYFNNLTQYNNTDNQTAILVWEDNFTKYSNGAIPMYSKRTSGASGVQSGGITNEAYIWGFSPQGGSTLEPRFNLSNSTVVFNTEGTWAAGAGFIGARSQGTGGANGLRFQDCTDVGCDAGSGSFAIYSDYLGGWLTKTGTTWTNTKLITFQTLGTMAQGYNNSAIVVTASGMGAGDGAFASGESGFSIGGAATILKIRLYNNNVTVYQSPANYSLVSRDTR